MRLIFFFLFIGTSLFSQEYKFDYIIKFLSVNKKTGYQDYGIWFVNSKDRSYKGQLLAFSKGDTVSFYLNDKKRGIAHDFAIKRTESPNIAANYKYKNTNYFIYTDKVNEEQSAYRYEETFIEKTGDGKKINLKKYKNSKSKKPEIVMTADYTDFEADLRPFAFESLFSTNADNVKLENTDLSYIKHTEWNIKGVEGEYNAEVLKVDLTLKVDSSKVVLPKEKPKSADETIKETIELIEKRKRGF